LIYADFHIHTKHSPDASIEPKTIVEQLNTHPHIKAAAITDHNTIRGALETQTLAESYADILIIPGAEIQTIEGEIILLGIAELPPKHWTMKNVMTYAKRNNALTIAPHPYRGFGLRDTVEYYPIDAVETLNGVSTPEANGLAENLAKAAGLPAVAGSDAHQLKELWSMFNQVDASLNQESIFASVRKGSTKPMSTNKSIHF
jgi:predicted metal-dependent phosphoesterase TrpH